VTLDPVATEEYVRDVLPETYALWGRHRTFERYVDDFTVLANSPYGKRRKFTVGLRVEGRLAASCKLYDREMRWGDVSLRATGIGAVFTPSAMRGRGYASVMLGALLDAERAAGRDLAFLFSDIHPLFYERLGFSRLPSRLITLRAATLDGSHAGSTPAEARDWPGVRRCFDAMEAQRPWRFRRTPLVWEWMRRKWTPSPDGAQSLHLVIRRARTVIAYAIGRRVAPHDTFALDDFAFDGDEGRARLPALLRACAGDLRRVAGWLPPPGAREALPRGSVRSRPDAIFMTAPLSAPARAWWAANGAPMRDSAADPIWSADHV
jgi:GNAT superfamily N-acetyltransferase